MTGGLEHGSNESTTKRPGGYPRKPLAFVISGLAGIFAIIAVVAGFSVTGNGDAAPSPVVAAASNSPEPTGTPAAPSATAVLTHTPTPTAFVQPTSQPGTPTGAPTDAPATSIAATPSPAASPASSLSPAAATLARSVEVQFGVRIVEAGQDWGTTDELQVRNITGVQDALTGVPGTVLQAVNARLPLAFLSNHTGATEAGWEPYGHREANYYSNEDLTTTGRVPANQVVLQPGSNSQTIAHEVMHSYQMRDVPAGQYALALLTPEMKSFMQATGWVQLGSDDDVRAAVATGWDGVNALFRYDGRPLTYTNEFGDSMSLFVPNPVEAYAEAGGLYYGHNSGLVLPDWPEYWNWFQANVG